MLQSLLRNTGKRLFAATKNAELTLMNGLPFQADMFKNVHLRSPQLFEKLPADDDLVSFLSKLEAQAIKEHEATALWLYVDLEHASQLPILVE